MKLFSLIALMALPLCTIAQKNRPNIIFILSDDHAYQATSAYGNQLVQTPNIDRIANEGALLENNFVANSICGPSRATLLTGKFSHKNGYYDNGNTPFDTSQLVFPQLLQEYGYQTAWIGKMHLNALPKGFNYLNVLAGNGGQGTYYNPLFVGKSLDTVAYKGYVSNLISDFFFDWLSRRDTTKPFFAVVGEKATHREWLPDVQDLGAYDSITFPLPDDFFDQYDTRLAAQEQNMSIDKTMLLKEDLKVGQKFGSDQATYGEYKNLDPTSAAAFTDYYGRITADFKNKKLQGKELVKWKFQRYLKDYYATAKSMDRNIGRILDYLDSTGLSKNTVVIYASDQGFYLGEHGWFDKRFIYDQSLRTAFLVKYTGIIRPKTRVCGLVSNVDWAPTILDLAGIQSPKEIQGQSFLPLLEKRNVKIWPKGIYYHYYEFPQPHHVSPHFGIRTKDFVLVRYYKGVESWELFDLKKDPKELHNVYNDTHYQKLMAQLKEALKKQILKFEDKVALNIFEQHI